MNASAGLAAVLLNSFFVFEGRSRVGDAARSLDPGAQDRGTTRLIGASFGASLVLFALSTWLAVAGIGVLPPALAWAGAVVMILGIVLRLWSAAVLGASYTRTLRVSAGQRLIRSGPYRFLRHPGYAGSILLWTGAALASGGALGVVTIIPLTLWAYLRRVAAEDRMLVARFGDEYAAYVREVRRLVPFVY